MIPLWAFLRKALNQTAKSNRKARVNVSPGDYYNHRSKTFKTNKRKGL